VAVFSPEGDRVPHPDVWKHAAACRDADLSLFFGVDGERRTVRRARLAEALTFCGRCPVVVQCREWSMWSPEKTGVWGGLDTDAKPDDGSVENEWQRIRRSRQRRALYAAEAS